MWVQKSLQGLDQIFNKENCKDKERGGRKRRIITNANTKTLGEWLKKPQEKYDMGDHSPQPPPLKRFKPVFFFFKKLE